MNKVGLILGTVLLVLSCWTSSVWSRSLDVAAESENAQIPDLSNPMDIPGILEFEGSEGDNDLDGDGVRDKRTPRIIFRTVSCLFTFLVNPSCLQGLTGGGSRGGSSGSSSSSNRRQQNEPYYVISLPRYNDTDNGTATEYPIYPIENTSEYPDDTTSRPTNPIMALIQWKLNLIPNLIRRFFPGFGGGRRAEGGSGSGGLFGGSGFNLGSLGLGGGRLAGLFGGGGGQRGFGGFGGLGGAGGGQY